MERNRVEKNDVSGMQKGMDASQRKKRIDFSELNILDNNVPYLCNGEIVLSVELKYAEIALKFYEKRENAEFGILEVLFSNRAKLVVPGIEDVRLWCHVVFIAKPRKAGCIDESPKHFFGEMLFDRATEEYTVTYCSIFEPNDPRNIEGCVICPDDELHVHPAVEFM
ncbi:uncharacterized protein [Euphorbia lathyris]|uniref:uncharacterized protein n=1 Tax=Euphorbia lathyris TaxID=212925 RepID=UPI0033139DD7